MKMERSNKRYAVDYGLFWFWFIGISIVYWFWAMPELEQAVSDLPFVEDEIADWINESVLLQVIKYAAFGLLWWTVIKLTVIHGSPISPWFIITRGRENEGKSGRHVSMAHLGNMDVYRNDYTGPFYFGAVLRSHPRSDRLRRSRLESLVVALPACTLLLEESRIYLQQWGHKDRAEFFRRHTDEYSGRKDFMPEDRFRKEVERHLRTLASKASNQVKRIDGLNWLFYLDGGGRVTDDFGFSFQFNYDGDRKKYVIKEETAEGEDLVLISVEELRGFASKELTPISNSDAPE